MVRYGDEKDGRSMTVVGRRPPSATPVYKKYKLIGLACLLW